MSNFSAVCRDCFHNVVCPYSKYATSKCSHYYKFFSSEETFVKSQQYEKQLLSGKIRLTDIPKNE